MILALLLAGATCTLHHAANGMALPDTSPGCTPGATRDASLDELCRRGKWKGKATSRDARSVSEAVKRQVAAEYGQAKCAEVDHDVSLELGGSNVLANLWCQLGITAASRSTPEFRVKDRVETHLNWLVCHGQMKLADAQQLIRTDWTRGIALLPAKGKKR